MGEPETNAITFLTCVDKHVRIGRSPLLAWVAAIGVAQVHCMLADAASATLQDKAANILSTAAAIQELVSQPQTHRRRRTQQPEGRTTLAWMILEWQGTCGGLISLHHCARWCSTSSSSSSTPTQPHWRYLLP